MIQLCLAEKGKVSIQRCFPVQNREYGIADIPGAKRGFESETLYIPACMYNHSQKGERSNGPTIFDRRQCHSPDSPLKALTMTGRKLAFLMRFE